MATENIPQIDNLIKDFGKQFQEEVKRANKTLEQVGAAIKKYQESEKKSMLHNVTVKYEENKVLEKYWLMRAEKKEGKYPIPYSEAVKEKELDQRTHTKRNRTIPIRQQSRFRVCGAELQV